MELNADLAPIKPPYFEPAAKRKDSGRKYSGLYGKTFVIKCPYFIQFKQNSFKNFNTYLLYGAHSLDMVKI